MGDYIHPGWRDGAGRVLRAVHRFVRAVSRGMERLAAALHRLVRPSLALPSAPDGFEAIVEPTSRGGWTAKIEYHGRTVTGLYRHPHQVSCTWPTYESAVREARRLLKHAREVEAERAAHPERVVLR